MSETGMLGLCLLMAAKQRSLELLRETLQVLGATCTEKEGAKLYKLVQVDLEPTERDWLQGQMLKLYDSASRCTQHMPYTAYLWRSREAVSLSTVVSLRLSPAERDRLDRLAQKAGLSRCEFARQMLREQLTESPQP